MLAGTHELRNPEDLFLWIILMCTRAKEGRNETDSKRGHLVRNRLHAPSAYLDLASLENIIEAADSKPPISIRLQNKLVLAEFISIAMLARKQIHQRSRILCAHCKGDVAWDCAQIVNHKDRILSPIITDREELRVCVWAKLRTLPSQSRALPYAYESFVPSSS